LLQAEAGIVSLNASFNGEEVIGTAGCDRILVSMPNFSVVSRGMTKEKSSDIEAGMVVIGLENLPALTNHVLPYGMEIDHEGEAITVEGDVGFGAIAQILQPAIGFVAREKE